MAQIPPSNIPLVDNKGLLRSEWYRFLATLDRATSAAGAGEVAAGDGLEGGGLVANGVTLGIADNGVGDAMLRQGAATSVIGRMFGSTGNITDIQATADNRVLARQGGLLVFTGAPTFDALSLAFRAITASASVGIVDYYIAANATGGAITVTLPALAQGRLLVVKKTDASANTVTLSGAANIDGAATAVLATQYESVSVIGGTSEWHII